MSTFIQGLAVPLNLLNKNNWGVPFSEADNVIASLKNSVLKICPGEAHACDYSEDPFGRIGRVADAWLEPDGVHASAEVTDSVAARKIEEGTWDEHNWSVFGDSSVDPKINDGWVRDFAASALTLVRNPAWAQSQYSIAAAEDGGKFQFHIRRSY